MRPGVRFAELLGHAQQFPSRMMRMKQFLREATTKTPLCFWRGKPNQLKNWPHLSLSFKKLMLISICHALMLGGLQKRKLNKQSQSPCGVWKFVFWVSLERWRHSIQEEHESMDTYHIIHAINIYIYIHVYILYTWNSCCVMWKHQAITFWKRKPKCKACFFLSPVSIRPSCFNVSGSSKLGDALPTGVVP